MFCKNCGEQIDDKAFVCPKCGVATGNTTSNAVDASSVGFSILGFFLPLIGLIMWLVWKDSMPLRAKSCGKGALIGVIVEVVLGVISGIIMGSLLGSMMYYY